jgi:hypothetical protein
VRATRSFATLLADMHSPSPCAHSVKNTLQAKQGANHTFMSVANEIYAKKVQRPPLSPAQHCLTPTLPSRAPLASSMACPSPPPAPPPRSSLYLYACSLRAVTDSLCTLTDSLCRFVYFYAYSVLRDIYERAVGPVGVLSDLFVGYLRYCTPRVLYTVGTVHSRYCTQ